MAEIKLQKDLVIEGKFYLKSGAILEESVTFEAGKDTYEDAQELMESINSTAKESFRNNNSFVLWFGDAIIRGDDLSSFTLKVKE